MMKSFKELNLVLENENAELRILLQHIYEYPQSENKPSKLKEKFNEDIVESAIKNGFVVGQASYNSPLLLTLKGKSFLGMDKIPHNVIKKHKRNTEYFVAFVDITGKTFKPYGAVKELNLKNKYFAQIELPISQFWDVAKNGIYATIDDAKEDILLPRKFS